MTEGTQEFRRRWRALVARHVAASEEDRPQLLVDALALGLDDTAPPESGPVPSVEDEVDTAIALVEASGRFDAAAYVHHNPDVPWDDDPARGAARHWVMRGWRELRSPWAGFDVWFYWNEHLDPAQDDVDPLVHYLLAGRFRGAPTAPAVEHVPPAPDPSPPLRRACLFASYDVDGFVDPSVVTYLAELSRFADVYFLADATLEAAELDLVTPYTRGRWAVPHGRYDFGSYSMLARELVGWDVLDQYDEVLLANDSCYLVQPLDEVFATMDATTCDWWGLQATYDHFGDRELEERGGPWPLAEALQVLRGSELWRYSDFLHVGSYFVAYRRRVLSDLRFRRRLETVVAQPDKASVIKKYEIGFTRLLVMAGYELATYVDGILAFHPIYRASAFEVLHAGFPLLKRELLRTNPFAEPAVARWKERVLAAAPEAPVQEMERHLRRVSTPWELERAHSGEAAGAQGLDFVDPDRFDHEDGATPRHDHWWIFPTDAQGRLSSHLRAVFEQVRDDPSVKKLVFAPPGATPRHSGRNVVVTNSLSPEGQLYALRAGVVFVTGGPRADLPHPLSPRWHRFVDLGDPAGATWWESTNDMDALHDIELTGAVALASKRVRRRAARRFPHLPDSALWVTGSPRLDFVTRPEDQLPPDLREQLAVLHRELEGRPLVMLAPTSEAAARIVCDHAQELVDAFGDDAAVGFRPLVGDAGAAPGSTAASPLVDLSADRFFHPEVVWRVAHVLLTDSPVDLAEFPGSRRRTVHLDSPDLLTNARQALAESREDPPADPSLSGRNARRVVQATKASYVRRVEPPDVSAARGAAHPG